MSALTDLFTTMANKIRSKTGAANTYTPAQMASTGIDDVYNAGVASVPALHGLTNLGHADFVNTTAKTINLSESLNNFTYFIILDSASAPSSTGYKQSNSVTCLAGASIRTGFTTKWTSSTSSIGECTLTISDITDNSMSIKADKATSKNFYVFGIK